MPARLKYPVVPVYVPGESMAEDLAMSGVDLADDQACILLLISFGYRAKHIAPGLDAAQEAARQIRGVWAPALPEAA
jgi:hypothetical protein